MPPAITVTLFCPPTNAPIGGSLVFTGVVCNTSLVTLSNVTVTNFVAGVGTNGVIGAITLGPAV